MPSFSLDLARDRQLTLLGVVGFAVALSAASQVAIPIPGSPVPMTLQPLAVVLAGLWLGPVAGAASMVLYVIAGALGAPVFAPIGAPGVLRLLGPTGGYILAYPAAALVAGLVSRRRGDFRGRLLAAALGVLTIHIGGVTQLALLDGSLVTALSLGSIPFLALDAVKVVLAALVTPSRTPRAPA